MQPIIERVDTRARLYEVLTELDALPDGTPCGFDMEAGGPQIRKQNGKMMLDFLRATTTGFSLSWYRSGKPWCCYVPVDHADGPNVSRSDAMHALRMVAARSSRLRMWIHNAEAELQFLRNEGIILDLSDGMWDSLVAAWLCGWNYQGGELALKALRVSHAGLEPRATFEEVANKRLAREVPVADMVEYAALDAYDAMVVGELAWAELARLDGKEGLALQKHFREIDMPCVEIIRHINAQGFVVDTDAVQAFANETDAMADATWRRFELLTRTVLDLPAKVSRQAVDEQGEPIWLKKKGPGGVMLPKMTRVEIQRPAEWGADAGNDRQVARWLYDELKLWPTTGLKRGGTGNWPVDKETVEGFIALGGRAAELAQLRLDYQKYTKLVSTYARPLLDLPAQYGTGRLHARFNMTGTMTQRLSSSGPNLQNMPSRSKEGKAIRKALKPHPGHVMVVVDMSQAELRVWAHLSRDPELSACYVFDEDVHAGTLAKLIELGFVEAQRTDAKVTNFSTSYLISAKSLAVKIRNTEPVAQICIDAFNGRFARIPVTHEWAFKFVAEHGYMKTLDGFRRPLDPRLAKDYKTGRLVLNRGSQGQAMSTAVQGSVGGFAKIAMRNLSRQWRAQGIWGTQVRILAQEHDSLVLSCAPEVADAVEAATLHEMGEAIQLRVPFKADAKRGQSWGECK